jgi:hypothetical protein|tara:strand:- start:1071 stop:1244 length:174 start_codon:yes stop_codon:yes gene_type:complete
LFLIQKTASSKSFASSPSIVTKAISERFFLIRLPRLIFKDADSCFTIDGQELGKELS